MQRYICLVLLNKICWFTKAWIYPQIPPTRWGPNFFAWLAFQSFQVPSILSLHDLFPEYLSSLISCQSLFFSLCSGQSDFTNPAKTLLQFLHMYIFPLCESLLLSPGYSYTFIKRQSFSKAFWSPTPANSFSCINRNYYILFLYIIDQNYS